MRDNRIFTAAAILLLAIWAGYNLYLSYTSPSYCPMGNYSIYSYSNLLPILLIVILALSLLPRTRSPPNSSKLSGFPGQSSSESASLTRKARNANSESILNDGQDDGGVMEGKEVSGSTKDTTKSVDENIQKTQHKNILSIIRENSGITQEELREITGYSASKISIEVRELEERGLIRREKHGRTFRIYPE